TGADGISLYCESDDQVEGGVITKNTVTGNNQEALRHAGNGTVISKNTMTDPDGTCEQARVTGDGNRVEKNKIGGSSCYALWVAGEMNEILKNALSANGSSVMFLSGQGQLAQKNKLDGSGGANGAVLGGEGGHTFDKNKIVGADGLGLNVNSGDNVVTGNTIAKCIEDGVGIWGSSNELTGNKVLKNGQNGVGLWGGTGNELRGNKMLKNNTNGDEDTYDLHVEGLDSDNTIDGSNKFKTRSAPTVEF
ncbi:MAG: right-handed parallel beta-helix repeat-containing protein, partial [Planctomycetota bacterium]